MDICWFSQTCRSERFSSQTALISKNEKVDFWGSFAKGLDESLQPSTASQSKTALSACARLTLAAKEFKNCSHWCSRTSGSWKTLRTSS